MIAFHGYLDVKSKCSCHQDEDCWSYEFEIYKKIDFRMPLVHKILKCQLHACFVWQIKRKYNLYDKNSVRISTIIVKKTMAV